MVTLRYKMVNLAAMFGAVSFLTTATAARPTPDGPARESLEDECVSFGSSPPPFTHSYTLRSGGKLVFVGVLHGSDLQSPTFTQIQAAVGQPKVSAVLVEGASSDKSTSEDYRKFLSDTATRRLALGGLTENLFAVKLSDDRKIRFAGWDLTPDQLYRDSVRAGFPLFDVIGAHLLRSKVDPLDAKSVPKVQAELRYAAKYGSVEGFDYPSWYRKQYDSKVDLSAGTPCGAGVASRIVKYETRMRNENLINTIRSYSTPGAVVVVEAGAAHWLALKGYLASISSAVL